jgi:dTDP-4-amino-4,6-dideoxygalactose transaminase
MPVPFIDLSRLVKELAPSVREDWTDVLAKCEFVGGTRVTQLEKTLAGVLGAEHVIACANGTDAILIALQASGLRPGDKVALPNLTFWATYEAVAQLGCVPVLVDIDPDDLQMSLDDLRSAHEKHGLRGVVLVHLFGWASARLEEFRVFCKDRKLVLVEDAAQAIGVEAHGTPVLSKAPVATLSFYPAKVIGGAMDGGAIVTSDGDLAARMRSLCNHGRSQHYSYAHVGWNSRMGGVQAAFLLRTMARYKDILDGRRKAVGRYEELVREPGIRVYGPPEGIVGNGYLFVATSDRKSGPDLAAALTARGIGNARTYPETIDEQPPARGAIRASLLERSRAFCKRVINLPLFWGITEDEIVQSASALVDVHRAGR